MTSVDEFRAAIAPSGALRPAINLGNPILASVDSDGKPQGISVEIARTLAIRLGLGFEPIVFATARESVKAVRVGGADLGFFAVDPARSDGLRFTKPYLAIEGAYMVRLASQIETNDEVDREGVRIAVGHGSAYDHFLSRTIEHASIVRAPTSPDVVDFFLAESLDVAAGVKQQLEFDAERLGGLRLLPGRFMEIMQAVGVAERRGEAAAAYLQNYIADIAKHGVLSELLTRNGVRGVRILS